MSGYTPKPGDIGLTHIGGAAGGAFTLGQFLALRPSIYSHTFLVIDEHRIIAGQPRGARIDPMESVINDRPLAFLPVPEEFDDRRDLIVNAALAHEDVAYGFAAYPLIGLARLAELTNTPELVPQWLKDRVASGRSLICSAFVDRMWEIAGIHLFRDERLRGAVMPSEIAHVGTIHHIGTGPYASIGGAVTHG